MIPQVRPLIEVLAEIPDCRTNRGKRHPLGAILALACSAMLCGYRSYTAIAEWGRHYGEHLVRALGFTHRSPCAATLHTVLRRVDREAFETQLVQPGRNNAPFRRGVVSAHRSIEMVWPSWH